MEKQGIYKTVDVPALIPNDEMKAITDSQFERIDICNNSLSHTSQEPSQYFCGAPNCVLSSKFYNVDSETKLFNERLCFVNDMQAAQFPNCNSRNSEKLSECVMSWEVSETFEIEYEGLQWPLPKYTFLAILRNGYVAQSGLVFNERFAIANSKWYYTFPDRPVTVVRHNEPLLSLMDKYSDSFQHTIFDILPRLSIICTLLLEDTSISVLVSSAMSRGLVHLFCPVEESRLQIHSNVPQQKSTSLIHVVHTSSLVYFPHFQFREDEKSFMGLSPVGLLKPETRSKANMVGWPLIDSNIERDLIVYLSRGEGCRPRQVAEEKNLLRYIEESLDFKFKDRIKLVSYEPKNDVFRGAEKQFDPSSEDIRLLSRARILIGPHGGAMANMVFCGPGTKVIEFLPLSELYMESENPRPCYFGLANSLGFEYLTVTPKSFSFDAKAMVMDFDDVLHTLHTALHSLET